MIRDLPGQQVMPFAEDAPARPAQGPCTVRAEALPEEGAPILALPGKATCTPPEAARVLGCTGRQIRHLVDDGTLLAIDVGRHAAVRHGSDGRRTPWRVVVRRGAEFAAPEFATFLTLEEFIRRRSNLEA